MRRFGAEQKRALAGMNVQQGIPGMPPGDAGSLLKENERDVYEANENQNHDDEAI